MISTESRIERLKTFHKEGRLNRVKWQDTGPNGKERSLRPLAAFSPEAGAAKSASACHEAMPPWLAHLTPFLASVGSQEAWPSVASRYIDVLPKLLALSSEKLSSLEYETRAIAIQEALTRTKNEKAIKKLEDTVALLNQAAQGIVVKDWPNYEKAPHNLVHGMAQEKPQTTASIMFYAKRVHRDVVKLEQKEHEGRTKARKRAEEGPWDTMIDKVLSTWEAAV